VSDSFDSMEVAGVPTVAVLDAQVREAADVVRRGWAVRPLAGLVLGTGMGHLADSIRIELAVDYADIPHFARSTAPGHRGRLVCGTLGGVPVITLDGRQHVYEGHPAWRLGLPIRLMRELGADRLILTNASGGLNPQFVTGDVMVLTDHLNFLWDNPLVGRDESQLARAMRPVFSPYDVRLIDAALAIARRCNFAAYPGVYAAMTGPCYETRAEYRMLRRLGADAVGMSTVPEAIVAAHSGMRVLAMSVITNVPHPDQMQTVTAEEVLADAARAEPNVRSIVEGILAIGCHRGG
jgi:purine-nucleoside phosphorylase